MESGSIAPKCRLVSVTTMEVTSTLWTFWTPIAAAVIAGAVAVTGYLYNAVAARKERARRTYADAISAVMDYKGLPFRIRRRGANDAATRTELLALASSLHERLDFYQALIYLERPLVGEAYVNLVSNVRLEAGAYCDDAWASAVLQDDREVTLGLGSQYEFPDTKAAADHCLDVMLADLRRRFLSILFWSYFRPKAGASKHIYGPGNQ